MDWAKIEASANPKVEYIIQSTLFGILAGIGTAPAAATAAAPVSAASAAKPAPAPVAKKESEEEIEPISIFGGDDGW